MEKRKRGHGKAPTDPSVRFWSHVQKGSDDECWEWTGAKTLAGYGFMFAGIEDRKAGTRWVRSNRLSWEIHRGAIPDGLSVLHHCDNPSCVNPAHLYVGTQAQNNRDRGERKRGKEHRQYGAANDNAKLTEADVMAIIALLKTGRSQIEIGRIFGIKQPQVSRIARRVAWRHLWEE